MAEKVRSSRDAIPWIVCVLAVLGGFAVLLASDAFKQKALAAIIAFVVAMASAVVGIVDRRRTRSGPIAKIRRGAFATGPNRRPLLAKDALLSDMGVHPALADVDYVSRGVEDHVRDAIARGESVLIVGRPLAGKSRLLGQLLRTDDRLREMPILIPIEAKAVHDLLFENARFTGHIVFFPRFEETLANNGLSSNDMDRISEMGNIAVATLESRIYETVLGVGAELPIDTRRVLERFHVIRLRTDSAATRRELAKQLPESIARGVVEFGLGEYLAGGGEAERRFRDARDLHPYAYALLRAAVDWRRSGISEAVPNDVAVGLVGKYYDALGLAASNESADEQVRWAEEWLPSPERRVFRLLEPEKGSWLPFGHLTALVEQDPTHLYEGIPKFVWEEIAQAPARPEQLTYAAVIAYWQDPKMDTTLLLAQRAAEAGDARGMLVYGTLLAERDNPEAETWYRKSADAGDPLGMSNYGYSLEQRGDPGAEDWYRQSAEAGYPVGMFNYAAALTRRGDPEAERWYRKAAEAGYPSAMGNYGTLLAQRDDPTAEDWLRKSAEAGDLRGMSNYGTLLAQREDARAEMWLRKSAEGHDPTGMANYGALLEHRGDETAEDWLRMSADAGSPGGMANYGHFLEQRGDPAAKDWYRKSAEAGKPHRHGALRCPPAAAVGIV
ncbi:hypothetical protein ACFQ58_04900 [Agromyces sp. NPDC056523]|uniref:tetratricopeptide repeat protein n=1 Tax=Agromyces sp. NPDC056523 TaxID=3345850 RepID=UPI00366E313F